MHRTTIFLPEDVEQRLDDFARQTGRPRAHVVREAIVTYLEEQVRPKSRLIGSANTAGSTVGARNAKAWVRQQWDKKWARQA
jgi:predicted transcriptional regulator